MANLPPNHNEFALAAEATPNNNNRWIEWDVPLGGEMDVSIVDSEFDEMDDDDDDVWDEDDEWLMAPVTPSRDTVTVSSTYEVGGPSTATPVGHPLAIMAPGVATQPHVIDDLCIYMDNLEYKHEVLTRKMEAVSDAEVANSIAFGEIHTRVTTVEEQVQTLQTALHGAELQNQQLRTRVAEMESREGPLKDRSFARVARIGQKVAKIDEGRAWLAPRLKVWNGEDFSDIKCVRWDSRRAPEYTWEREDQMKNKYPHLFTSNPRTDKSNRALGRRSRKEGRM
ncbi:hypothetical protein Tco_0260726 [Tanacetum coccineum]